MLSQRQRQARNLILILQNDKKRILESRRKTASSLGDLHAEVAAFEDSQVSMENLRFIYPLQDKIRDMTKVHDEYGKLWDMTCDNLEVCWSELMVTEDEAFFGGPQISPRGQT